MNLTKKIFWIGGIGYKYETKDDLLKSIREDLRKDIFLPSQLAYVEEIDRPYTKKEAQELLDYYSYHVGLIDYKTKTLLMYWAKFGNKKITIFDYM